MCKYTEMEVKPSKKPRFLLKVIDAPFLLVQKKCALQSIFALQGTLLTQNSFVKTNQSLFTRLLDFNIGYLGFLFLFRQFRQFDLKNTVVYLCGYFGAVYVVGQNHRLLEFRI